MPAVYPCANRMSANLTGWCNFITCRGLSHTEVSHHVSCPAATSEAWTLPGGGVRAVSRSGPRGANRNNFYITSRGDKIPLGDGHKCQSCLGRGLHSWINITCQTMLAPALWVCSVYTPCLSPRSCKPVPACKPKTDCTIRELQLYLVFSFSVYFFFVISLF